MTKQSASARETRKATRDPASAQSRSEAFVHEYPPLSRWTPDHLPALKQALLSTPANKDLAIYVHIPFCREKCLCCPAQVYPGRRKSDVQHYVQTIHKERRLYDVWPLLQNRKLRSVYLGGGSPTYLSVNELTTLVGRLVHRGDWESLQEFTVECEATTFTAARARALKSLGVTRITLGFQSLNDDILRRNGCSMRVRDCLSAFNHARKAQIPNLTVELVAGLPGETEASWRTTLQQVLGLQPDAVTVYPLETNCRSVMEPPGRRARDGVLPSPEARSAMTDAAFQSFESASYQWVTSNTVALKPARYQCIHWSKQVWSGCDLLALGQSACGYLQGVLYQNAGTFDEYVKLVANGDQPVVRALALSRNEQLRREVVLQLRSGRLDPESFRVKFGANLDEHFGKSLRALQKQGWLVEESGAFALSRRGRLELDRLLPSLANSKS